MSNNTKNLMNEIERFNFMLKELDIKIEYGKFFKNIKTDNTYYADYYVGGRSVSELNFRLQWPVIEIALLRTPLENNRRKSYAKNLLAIVLKSAQRAGYEIAVATSVFMNKKNRNKYTPKNEGGPLRPLSAPLFNKFNFGVINKKEEKEYRRLNMTRNMTGVNAVIRNLFPPRTQT